MPSPTLRSTSRKRSVPAGCRCRSSSPSASYCALEYQQRTPTGEREQEALTGLLEDELDGMVVDHLGDGAAQLGDPAVLRVLAGIQLIAERHVLGRELAPAVGPGHILIEVEGPLGEVLVRLPALGDAVIVVSAGDRVVADQRAQREEERLIAARGPEEIGVAGRRIDCDHQPVNRLGLRRCADRRRAEHHPGEQRQRQRLAPVIVPRHVSLPLSVVWPHPPAGRGIWSVLVRCRRLYSAASIRCQWLRPFEVTPG